MLEKEKIHFSDALYGSFAIHNKRDSIVTFNIKDFKKIEKRIRIIKPLDFIASSF